MQQKLIVNSAYQNLKFEIQKYLQNFDKLQDILGKGDRNVIKIISIDDKKYAIKSFKIPNAVNQLAYRFFRKSKAQRSYEYASKLLSLGIDTPLPLAYQEVTSFFLFKNSYYISAYESCDLTYRELTMDFTIKDHEAILRAFTRFTYLLHKNGVNFLDHSPGNTLINRIEDDYKFYLVDLNRMKFGNMDFDSRIKNFAKLTIHKSMVEVMSNEYAKCTGEDEQRIFDLMWKYTREFQHRFYRKIRVKKRLFFWKKKYKNKISESPI